MGTALGGAILFLAGKAAGVLAGVPWDRIGAGFAVILVAFLIGQLIDRKMHEWQDRQLAEELEKDLRELSGEELHARFYPYGGPPSEIWERIPGDVRSAAEEKMKNAGLRP